MLSWQMTTTRFMMKKGVQQTTKVEKTTPRTRLAFSSERVEWLGEDFGRNGSAERIVFLPSLVESWNLISGVFMAESIWPLGSALWVDCLNYYSLFSIWKPVKDVNDPDQLLYNPTLIWEDFVLSMDNFPDYNCTEFFLLYLTTSLGKSQDEFYLFF